MSLTWSNVPAGDYVITARATDNSGATNVSGAITIHVISQADIPVVTVTANDAEASELGPDTGSFTLTRTGDTTGPLAVYYSLDGTARNGVDYERLPGVVNFAAGAPTTNVTVVPLPDLDFLDRTNDTVALQLRPVLSIRPGTTGIYTLGSPSNAVVTITENSNAVSRVTIVATDANAAEDGPDTATFQITRTGNTTDPLAVFYNLGGTARNGRDYQPLPGYITIPAGATVTNLVLTPILDVDTTRETNETVVVQLRPTMDFLGNRGSTPYLLGWPSNAVATIAESTTAPKDVPPVVRLLTPQDGAGFVGPANVTLIAQAVDPDGTVTNVQFFAGTTSLGIVTNTTRFDRYRGLYSLTWSNAALGQFVVTAQATDNAGLTSTSAPVNVVITANALPVVSIFAPDPIAYT